MNTVTVLVYAGGVCFENYETDDVNRAMDSVHRGWLHGQTTKFIGVGGFLTLEPPIESVVSQLPDDSQARHDRNRARWK